VDEEYENFTKISQDSIMDIVSIQSPVSEISVTFHFSHANDANFYKYYYDYVRYDYDLGFDLSEISLCEVKSTGRVYLLCLYHLFYMTWFC
jgi:hypothetical protein